LANSGAAPPKALVETTDRVVSFVVITFLFSFIFQVLPRMPLLWGDVTIRNPVEGERDSAMYQSVKSILKNSLDTLPAVEPSPSSPPPPHDNIRGADYFD
jgi:hypothetical protein